MKKALILLFLGLVLFCIKGYTQTGIFNHKSATAYDNDIIGFFYIEIKRDSIYFIEDFQYIENNVKKRFFQEWAEPILQYEKCNCGVYTESGYYKYTVKKGKFVSMKLYPIVGKGQWIYYNTP